MGASQLPSSDLRKLKAMITMIVKISALQTVAPDSRSQTELEKLLRRATGLTDDGLTIPIGRTDAEAETPIRWPPDSKS